MNVRICKECIRNVLLLTVRNLAKTSRLPVSKVFTFKSFLYKNYFGSTKIQENEGFCQIRKEIWYMDFAYVDKLPKENKGKKLLLVCQVLFVRIVNTKGTKTKDSQETVKTFSYINTKRNRPKKIWVDKGPNLLERLKRFLLLRGYKFILV